jgi:2-iminobutanoate/2-iminopropanoate deaminase
LNCIAQLRVSSNETPQENALPLERRFINLPDRRHNLPFSDAVLIGETLYLSGRIGIDPVSGVVPADVDEEIRLLLDGVRDVLKAASLTMDDLVYVQIFCPDLSLFSRFNEHYRTYFSRDLPARAFLGSGPLLLNGRFELQGIAVRR